LRTNNHLTGT